jgi:hypothetical protein
MYIKHCTICPGDQKVTQKGVCSGGSFYNKGESASAPLQKGQEALAL